MFRSSRPAMEASVAPQAASGISFPQRHASKCHSLAGSVSSGNLNAPSKLTWKVGSSRVHAKRRKCKAIKGCHGIGSSPTPALQPKAA
mmetsp:Transcript_9744/g.28954  ORF Transcript_9744/g.28954 Transcript_9744/m.28954 type:complete len:88 (-) Transcript_9744:1218-1481(-)